ncbi:polysaccharide pyruvyl transferase family protein [Oricola sp.]|uniref:polysaccharide pyruvyl transferase family protein n=1 Tax=Oricola sp. TaxID=1979950 RepID=UPI003BACD7E3
MNRKSRQHTAAMQQYYSDALSDLAPDGRPYALLDWPNHNNVGDSAIWLGEIEALRSLTGRDPSYVAHETQPVDDLPRYLRAGTVFLHGGGNFGDVWPAYHAPRIQRLELLKGYRIVQLAQTIHYVDQKMADEMARAIDAHGRFTLVVRDRKSLVYARRQFDCDVRLAPDAAYWIAPVGSVNVPCEPVVALMRTDKERVTHAQDADGLRGITTVFDWPPEQRMSRFDRRRTKHRRLLALLSRDPQAVKLAIAMRRTEGRLRHGLDLLARGEVVLTDRLHGHILSTLLGKPHVVLDNSYGKTTSYIESWPDDGLTHLVSDFHAARHLLAALLEEKRGFAADREPAAVSWSVSYRSGASRCGIDGPAANHVTFQRCECRRLPQRRIAWTR